jgi:hypothetical protein
VAPPDSLSESAAVSGGQVTVRRSLQLAPYWHREVFPRHSIG